MLRAVIKVSIILMLAAVVLYEGVKTLWILKPISPVVYSLQKKTLVLEGVVYNKDYPAIQRKFTHMPGLTLKLANLVKEGNTNIHIKINSTGGLMNEGMEFVYMMRTARYMGVTFTCIVDGNAMSMALIIFSECDNRYATFNSRLMWHSIAQNQAFIRLNEQTVITLLDFFRAKNEEIWASTRIHFYPWYFTRHFAKESILSALEVERNSIRYLRVIRQHIIQ